MATRVARSTLLGARRSVNRGPAREFAGPGHSLRQPCVPTRPLSWKTAPRCQYTLLESELFGHKRGAFYRRAPGPYRPVPGAAEGGTVLLDEIGDTSPAFQVEAAARVAGRRVGARGRYQHGTGQRAGDRRDPSQPGRRSARLECFRSDLDHRLSGVRLVAPTLARTQCRPHSHRPQAARTMPARSWACPELSPGGRCLASPDPAIRGRAISASCATKISAPPPWPTARAWARATFPCGSCRAHRAIPRLARHASARQQAPAGAARRHRGEHPARVIAAQPLEQDPYRPRAGPVAGRPAGRNCAAWAWRNPDEDALQFALLAANQVAVGGAAICRC